MGCGMCVITNSASRGVIVRGLTVGIGEIYRSAIVKPIYLDAVNLKQQCDFIVFVGILIDACWRFHCLLFASAQAHGTEDSGEDGRKVFHFINSNS